MNQTLSRKPVSSQASHLRFTTRELVLGGMFAALMAVISQLSIPMPNGVPITIQVFGIALIGVTLGWRLGCLSSVIYLLIGAVGLPVFANFGGGISRLVSLTGGYLWSYPLMAALCGIHPNTGNKKKDTALILLSSLAGLLLVETIGGLQWAALSGGSMSVSAVFAYAAVAFIPKDMILTVLAVFTGLSMRKVLNRITGC